MVKSTGTFPEDEGLIPSSQLMTIWNPSSRGIWCPLLAPSDTRHTGGAQAYMQTKHLCT